MYRYIYIFVETDGSYQIEYVKYPISDKNINENER